MAFGKLGSSDKDRGTDHPPLDGGKSNGWHMSLADIGLGLASVVIVFSGTYFFADDLIAAVKPGQAARPSNPIFAYEPEPRARSYDKHASVAPIFPSPYNMVLRMNVTEDGFDAIDSELHERCMKPINQGAARYAEVHGKVQVPSATAAQFLACSMQHQKSRLCEKPHRDRLVARLQEFVRVQKAFAAKIAQVSQTPQGQMMMDIAAISARNGKGNKFPRMPGPVVPPVLADQLRALSQVSLLSQADFNTWPFSDVPEDLKPYLAAEAGPSPCV